jgi:hypothetical protein
MSIAGLLSGSLFGNLLGGPGAPSATQKLKQEFQPLGQDLASGNLPAAQADLATLKQNAPQASASSTGSSNAARLGGNLAGQNQLTQPFQQLSQDLKAGNLAAAQSDYSALQQDFQSLATQARQGHRHPHVDGDSSGVSQANPINTLFSQLGQALQAGNLSSAQTAYTTLQADFEQFSQSNGVQAGAGSSVSVSV